MGGHGGLNILPQKSWHVWNRTNRERVARDEAEAAQQAADEEFNAAAERAGLNLMKLRARVTGEAGPSTTDRHAAPAGAGHVNFFADAEAAELLAQRDAAAKRKEAQEISRIMPDLDLSKSAREPKPWYAMPPRERAGDDAAPAGAGVVDAAVLWLPAPAIIPEGVADEGKHTRKRERHHRKHDKHGKHGKHDKKKKKKHHAHHDERAPAEALSESDEEAEARALRANSSLMPPPRPPPAPAAADAGAAMTLTRTDGIASASSGARYGAPCWGGSASSSNSSTAPITAPTSAVTFSSTQAVTPAVDPAAARRAQHAALLERFKELVGDKVTLAPKRARGGATWGSGSVWHP